MRSLVSMGMEQADKSYRVAEPLLEAIKRLLADVGVDATHADRWEGFIYLLLVVAVSLLLAWLLRVVLHRLFSRLAEGPRGGLLRELIRHRLFSGTVYIFQPLIVLAFLPWIYADMPRLIDWVQRLCRMAFVVAVCFYLNRIADMVWYMFSRRDAWRDRPLKGLVQLAKGILLGVAVVISVALLVGVSPMKLITGLGAFAAVLMLVFKDSILGFVAGVQLAQNDLVRRGDWITLPGRLVNGVVEDITLGTVKVRNFDHTLVSLPPYTLVAGEMQNWRGMVQSGARRIKRAFLIDIDTVTECSPEQLDALSTLPSLRDYIAAKRAQKLAGRVEDTRNESGLVNGSIESNLGLFRAYIHLYLSHHATIDTRCEIMARLLAATENGVPLEIYCFTTVMSWVDYESVQASIVEHILIMAPRFGLRVFQNATGGDYIAAAYITAGKPIPSPPAFEAPFISQK